VASAVFPDVLLVDEILAVGDIAFQLKSMAKMQRIVESGAAMVVVSHNVNLIRQLCQRSLVLESGRVVFNGATDEAISAFYHSMGRRPAIDGDRSVITGDGRAVDVEIEIFNRSGRPTRHFETGDTVTVRLEGTLHRTVESPTLGIILSTTAGTQVYRELFAGLLGSRRNAGRLSCSFSFRLRLAHGTYYVDAGILEGGFDLGQVVAWSQPLLFQVSGRELVDGLVDLGAHVDVVDDEPTKTPPGGIFGVGSVDREERSS
jgi:hypothetical protein